MHKKAMVAGSLGICLLLVISFSGCVNQEEKTDPAIQKIKDAGKLVVGFEDILDYVANGDVDIMIAAITINLERAQRVDFSNGYLNAGQVIIVNESNEDINNPEDLLGLNVGVQSGTTGEEEALKHTENVRGYGENFTSDAPLNLTAGEIDAIIVDYPVGAILIKGNSGLKIVGDPFTSEYYGIAIKKGETALQKELDKVINNLESSGEMQTLKDKWLSKT